MKLLLTLIMSTVITGSAFGACAVNSLGDCKASECEALNGDAKVKSFSMNGDKCVKVDTTVATNCLENNGSSGAKQVDSGAGAAGSTGAQGTGK